MIGREVTDERQAVKREGHELRNWVGHPGSRHRRCARRRMAPLRACRPREARELERRSLNEGFPVLNI